MDVSVATTGNNMSFQKIVLIVAIVILILTLSVIGYMMYTTARNTTFPPLTGTQRCPDKWTFDSSDNKCTNTNGLLNIGSFITDVSCSIVSAGNNCATSNMMGYINDVSGCSSGWVQGNTTNGRDVSNCYMLASAIVGTDVSGAWHTSHTGLPLEYTLKPSLSDNIQWAKTYGLSWDGYL